MSRNHWLIALVLSFIGGFAGVFFADRLIGCHTPFFVGPCVSGLLLGILSRGYLPLRSRPITVIYIVLMGMVSLTGGLFYSWLSHC